MSLLLAFPHPLSISRPPSLLSFNPFSAPKQRILSFSSTQSGSFNYHSLSLRFIPTQKKASRRLGTGTVCYHTALSALRPETLQWVCAVSSAVLMLTKGTSIQKSFLAPLFALQAPSTVISWIKGEYGGWSAFLALLVRLFYYIPGELELPFFALLLVIVSPYQAMNLRGTQAGAIISLAISAFLALQHFSRIGSLQRAFEKGSIIATLAIICITIIPCLFLF